MYVKLVPKLTGLGGVVACMRSSISKLNVSIYPRPRVVAEFLCFVVLYFFISTHTQCHSVSFQPGNINEYRQSV